MTQDTGDTATAVPPPMWGGDHRTRRKARVALAALSVDSTPRLGGLDEDHVRVLVEAGPDLPPILVHEASMIVIDGCHRVRAAQLRGEELIEAEFHEGSEEEAYVLAVHANVTHGLPLTMSDRVAATKRIINANPSWSNRRIAALVGLSHQTVNKIRRQEASDEALGTRVGLDGRRHPLTTDEGRRQARRLMLEKPHASLREIAQEVGLSPSTVRDVRSRLNSGLDVVPPGQRKRNAVSASTIKRQPRLRLHAPSGDRGVPRVEERGNSLERRALLARLRRDPSLRFNEAGRTLLRWLESGPSDDESFDRVVRSIPPHWADVVTALVTDTANAWTKFALRLSERADPD